MWRAVLVLRATMLSDATKPAQKVTAARAILELGLRSFELETLEARMAQIVAGIEELRTHAKL